MLLVNTRNETIFAVTPNSRTCLMVFTRSGPALASPITSAPELWAWSSGEDMSAVPSGCLTSPSTVPPAAFTALAASAERPLPKT